MFSIISKCYQWISKPRGVKAWNADLLQTAAELNHLSRDTESEFLSMGNQLCSFFGMCSENASRASFVVQMIESGSGLNIGAFQKSFDNAYRSAESAAITITNVLSGLENLTLEIEVVSELEQILEKLCHSIRFLSVSMKIEIARVGKTEFNVVAESVDTLYHQIIKYIDGITSSTDDVIQNINSTHDNVGKHLDDFQQELKNNRIQVRHILGEMGETTQQTQSRCKKIERLAAQITPEIGEVVASLQYHDISRQQIEHVSKALEEIISKIPLLKTAKRKEKILFCYWMSRVLELQIAQIQHVVDGTTETAENISRHFTRISEISKRQAEDANEIFQEVDASSHRIQLIGVELETLLGTLTASKKITSIMVGSISAISSNVIHVSDHLSHIEDIREDLDDLTINAVIKAIHAGKEGNVLGVLSENIRSLSNTAQQEIENKTSAINGILESSEQFKGEISGRLNEQLTFTDNTYHQTRQAIQQFIQDDKTVMSSMNDVSEVNKKLENDIAELIAGLKFDKVMKTHLETITHSLKKILKRVQQKIPANIEKNYPHLNTDLEKLAKRYTMHSQREIHDKFFGSSSSTKSAAAPTDLNVELFSDYYQSATPLTQVDNHWQEETSKKNTAERVGKDADILAEDEESEDDKKKHEGFTLDLSSDASDPKGNGNKPKEQAPPEVDFGDNVELF